MRKVIAFLGANPQRAAYSYHDRVYNGHAFPEALRHFIDYDRMIVFVTRQAREKSWPILQALNDSRIEPVDIPDGRNSAEMWAIFTRLTGAVEDGDTVIFDITHAFRSIPFFVFLAVAFLKSAYENVTIERVLYGALGLDDPAPVIDLTEFTDLLDWMSATDHFVRTGNSQALVEKVRAAGHSDSGTAEDRAKLITLAGSLGNVSQSLRLLIPDKAMAAGYRLHHSLQNAREPLQRALPPFLPLANRVDEAYQALALPDPRATNQIWRSLQREREMVNWYLDRQLLLQAIALAFEWLISYGVAHLGYKTLYDGNSRWTVRQRYTAVNNQRRNDKGSSATGSAELDRAWEALRGIPDLDHILDLYQRASKTRNDLMHASKTVHPKHTPAAREAEIRAICRELADFQLK